MAIGAVVSASIDFLLGKMTSSDMKQVRNLAVKKWLDDLQGAIGDAKDLSTKSNIMLSNSRWNPSQDHA
ncbi:hypothetical protein PanWU01x14_344500 [Parasponia andersonii]|uniref:Rx N-terminal domain-containing protein n=1 Tax=Parasponia andersonii TaxID=3476 RepID=A0A2P5ACZ9_PARAD|nr:hypothetical protein PanWU01x14_344500 [Parasponia andersonii]